MSVGRKLFLTKEKIKVICELIESGMFDSHVADAIGVSEVSWHNWKRRGKELQLKVEENENITLTEREQLYLDFYQSLNKAYATAEINAINSIKQATKEDWRAAAWYLERRFRGNWGRVAKVTETTPSHLQEFLKERGIK